MCIVVASTPQFGRALQRQPGAQSSQSSGAVRVVGQASKLIETKIVSSNMKSHAKIKVRSNARCSNAWQVTSWFEEIVWTPAFIVIARPLKKICGGGD